VFVGIFAYCIVVLRTIRGSNGLVFVPSIAVLLGVLLALVGVAFLVFFIHHVASSIQATTIADGLAKELDHVIQRLFPEQPGGDAPSAGAAGGADAPADLLPPGFAGSAQAIAAPADGYVQAADDDLLVALAERHDLVLRLEHRPGRFVIAGDPLLLAWPGERVDHARAQEILAAFVLGQQRTPPQDAEFVLDQIVEMAVRALSPGINDPFTAITCIDRMGQILARLGPRPMPTPFRRDRAGRVRLVAAPETFERLADGIFDPLRHYGRCHPMVLIRLLDVLGHAAAHAVAPARREILRRHADAILEEGRDALSHPRDRELLEAHHRRAAASLARECGRAEAAAPAPARAAPRPSRRPTAVAGTGFGSRR
ncbi:MAG TPA: DUF2254 domain-containing protein, partial [Geminicoccaceae bacterium]|nr:DUF2254 domain-containing protein [Geminicoccaceae bacterium]